MNTEIKSLWVEALRSGEYRQAQGKLRKDEGYCCLGVLCEIAVIKGIISSERTYRYHDPEFVWSYGKDKDWYSLPVEVKDWADVRDDLIPDEDCDLVDAIDHLIGLNDTGSTFSEIADLIEEHL
jgi:hypothetical protein